MCEQIGSRGQRYDEALWSKLQCHEQKDKVCGLQSSKCHFSLTGKKWILPGVIYCRRHPEVAAQEMRGDVKAAAGPKLQISSKEEQRRTPERNCTRRQRTWLWTIVHSTHGEPKTVEAETSRVSTSASRLRLTAMNITLLSNKKKKHTHRCAHTQVAVSMEEGIRLAFEAIYWFL